MTLSKKLKNKEKYYPPINLFRRMDFSSEKEMILSKKRCFGTPLSDRDNALRRFWFFLLPYVKKKLNFFEKLPFFDLEKSDK